MTFEAEVCVQVEASSEGEAEGKAREAFTRQDVEILSVLDVDLLTGDDGEE